MTILVSTLGHYTIFKANTILSVVTEVDVGEVGVLAWVSETLVFKRSLDLERTDVEYMSLEIRCSKTKKF